MTSDRMRIVIDLDEVIWFLDVIMRVWLNLTNLEKKDIQLSLNGFSGNIVEAYRFEDHTIIRKTVKIKNENQSLNSEFIKLKELDKISKKCDLFKIPKILSCGYDNNEKFYYELEFVPAENLDSSLQKLDSKKISEIFLLVMLLSISNSLPDNGNQDTVFSNHVQSTNSNKSKSTELKVSASKNFSISKGFTSVFNAWIILLCRLFKSVTLKTEGM